MTIFVRNTSFYRPTAAGGITPDPNKIVILSEALHELSHYTALDARSRMDPGDAELTTAVLSFLTTKARTERNKVTGSQNDDFC
jgi:hypothetical protein